MTHDRPPTHDDERHHEQPTTVAPAVPHLPSPMEVAAALAAGSRPPDDRRVVLSRRALDRRVMAVVEGMSDAFLAIDRDWHVTYANREAARLNGTTPDALIGRSHWEIWPETIGTELEQRYREVAQGGAPTQFEQHYARLGVWHDVRAYPADDGGIAVFYRDITAQRALEQERRRHARELADAHDKALAAETQFRLLVDRVRDYAIFLLDPDGIITHWGPGAERLKRWRPDEIVGRHLRDLYPREVPTGDGSAEEHLRHAAIHGEYIGEGIRARRDGELFPARVVLTALRRDERLIGFSNITQDLSAEHERQSQLHDAMRAAEAASVAKSQFLANTSHEIRTPLNAIMGYADLLELGVAGQVSDQQRQYVQRIQATSRHLLSLVNDVLDLSKIEAGHMHAAREPALVADTVSSAVSLVEPQANARGVQLVNACLGADIAYRGDVERVRQILANLLSNAVRFTEAGGRVTVSCGSAEQAPPDAEVTHAGPWTFLRVQDTGVGIATPELDRIWEAFVQADSSRTRRFGGSGLGLTISRHLARLMGGDIRVTSQQGLGSTFVLWLPAAAADDVTATRRDIESVVPIVANVVRPGAFEALSRALLVETEAIVARYTRRLHADPALPTAHALRDNEIEDHSVTLVSDMAQCISAIGADGPMTETLVRDGTEIQSLIARRHGLQRAQLGFTEAELRRDFAILRDEVEAALRTHAGRAGVEDAELALRIVSGFFDIAVRESAAAFRDARRGGREA